MTGQDCEHRGRWEADASPAGFESSLLDASAAAGNLSPLGLPLVTVFKVVFISLLLLILGSKR